MFPQSSNDHYIFFTYGILFSNLNKHFLEVNALAVFSAYSPVLALSVSLFLAVTHARTHFFSTKGFPNISAATASKAATTLYIDNGTPGGNLTGYHAKRMGSRVRRGT